MPLLSCECLSGKPIGEQLVAIYCALLEIVQNGGGGGTVNINDVEGVSDFWKAALGETPAANQVFGTDGSAVFATFDLSDVGTILLNAPTPASVSVPTITTIPSLNYRAGITSSQSPVGTVETEDGVVTFMS